jgi:hypothetical protein
MCPIFKKISIRAQGTQQISAYFLETIVTGQNVFVVVPYLSTTIVYRAAIDYFQMQRNQNIRTYLEYCTPFFLFRLPSEGHGLFLMSFRKL